MVKNTIKYIAFYDIPERSSENRNTCPAATNKVDYICLVLNRLGYEVEIISPSWTNNISGFYKGTKTLLTEKTSLRTFCTFGAKNKILRGLKYYFSLLQLFIFLLFNTKKNEKIIVYHSAILSSTLRLAKKIRKFKIILEVEEIYQDFQNFSNDLQKSEYKIFSSSSSYLFSTLLLNDKINKDSKPYCIINGTYKKETDTKTSFNDDKIHVVYAGTFDQRKGVIDVVEAAKFLSNKFHVHVLGFGNENEKNKVKERVDIVSKKSEATITFDGLLLGKDYIDFIQKCHIGMSSQSPDAGFNATSFPSKILSYMANGLRVVTVRIEAIEKSAVGKHLYYYDNPSPEEIAKTIMNVDINDEYDSRKIIEELDKGFEKCLKELI